LHLRFPWQAPRRVVEDELNVRSRFCGRPDLVRVGHVELQRNEPLVAQGAQRLSGLRAVA
jgi:hypothetical protein